MSDAATIATLHFSQLFWSSVCSTQEKGGTDGWHLLLGSAAAIKLLSALDTIIRVKLPSLNCLLFRYSSSAGIFSQTFLMK